MHRHRHPQLVDGANQHLRRARLLGQPVIMAGGRGHQAFCDVHLGPAADLALQFPTFPGWYRIEHITSVRGGQVTVTVHPLAS
jgi:hypothetical protein